MKHRILISAIALFLSAGSRTVCAESFVLARAMWPSWSPDGTEFVCDTYFAGIVRVSAAGAVLDTIAGDTPFQDVNFPIWHPDGKNVIYVRRDTYPEVGDWQIAIHDLTGGGTTIWPAPSLWDDFGISFYADSSEVLYDDSFNQIYALNVKTGSTRPFHTGAGASVSPDGKWLAYLKAVEDRDILVEPIGGGPSVIVGHGYCLMWTVDSGHVLYTDDLGDVIIATRDGLSSAPFLTGPDFEAAGSHSGTVLLFFRCGEIYCDIWKTHLSPVPVESKSWGEIKSRFR